MYNKGDRSSPAVARRQKEKHDKYQPIMHILQTLVMRRKKSVKPKFLAPVISHLGELSCDAFALFDLMSDEYKQRAKPFHRGYASSRKGTVSKTAHGCDDDGAGRRDEQTS